MNSTELRGKLYAYLLSLNLTEKEIDNIMDYINYIHLAIESENESFFGLK